MKRYTAIIIIVFLGVLSGLFISHNHYKNFVIQTEQQNLLNIVTTVSSQLESYFKENDRYYKELRDSPYFMSEFKNVTDGFRDRLTALELLYGLRRDQYDAIELFDADGNPLMHYGNVLEIDMKSLDKAMTQQRDVYYIENSHRQSIHMVYVIKEGVQTLGYVRMVYNAAYIYEHYIQQYRMHQTGYISLKDQEGKLFLHPSFSNIGTDVLEARRSEFPQYDWSELADSVSRQIKGETGVGSYHSVWPADGSRVKKINAYTPCHIGDVFLILNFSIDYKETLSSFEGITKATIVLTLLLTLISFSMILYIYFIEMKQKALEIESKYFETIKEKNAVITHQAKHVAMGEMIATITHQLKQPLNALKLSLYNLEDAVEVRDEHLNKLLEKNHQYVSKMAQTIDDFKRFFKPQETGQAFELKASLAFVLALNYDRIQKLKVHVEEVGDIDKILLYGEGNYFSQVLLNVINNALDALGEHGQIAFKRLRIFVEDSPTLVTIQIHDNGGGIEERMMPHLFKPYMSSKGEEGTGLGLYISKYVLKEKFNGQITIVNEGDGCLVTLSIPRRKSQ